MQKFIKLSAAVHALSCSSSFDDAENNICVGSNKLWGIPQLQ